MLFCFRFKTGSTRHLRVCPSLGEFVLQERYQKVLFMENKDLDGLRIIICLRKSEVSVDRILTFNVISYDTKAATKSKA